MLRQMEITDEPGAKIPDQILREYRELLAISYSSLTKARELSDVYGLSFVLDMASTECVLDN